MPIRTCLQCGNEFQAPTNRAKYCKGRCYNEMERAYSRRHAATYSVARRRAAVAVEGARYKGKLVPRPCEVCGASNTVAHHDDYAAPLDVRWLCRSHHKIHHNQFGPGLNA